MGLNTTIVKGFRKGFETKCLTLLIDAYHTSITNHNYSTGGLENDFTSMLVNNIDKDPRRLRWDFHCHRDYHLHNDIPQFKKGFANKEDIIDIRMSKISSNQEYCFYVEAKRLKENNSGLLNRYINTGIDHYISKKYPQGILLSYLVEGGVDATIQKINDILTKKKRVSEMLKRQSHSLHDHYFESTHLNYGVISHFVFDYTV